MQLLSNAEIDNICRRAADYTHTWAYESGTPASILDFYLIDMFRNFYNTGLRFYELADPTKWSNPSEGIYICQTLKGSDPRTFNAIELSDYFINCLNDNVDPYPMCRYSTAVRYFKKVILHINVVMSGRGISIHLFRHNKVKQMKDDFFTTQEISDYLGEVDNRNTTEYITSDIYQE